MKNEFNFDELRGIDLNLCLVLSVMVREQSVRRSAEVLRLGAPAVSMAVNRLRGVFSDPLFVRTGRGMIATPRAVELAELVNPFLESLRTTLRGARDFDPATVERTVRLAIADDLEIVLLADLFACLRAKAPGVTLQVRDANYLAIDETLQSGDAHISVVALTSPLPREAHRVAYVDRFLALYDPGQIGLDAPITLEAYLATPHLLMSPRGDTTGMIEPSLMRLGVQREVVGTLARFSTLQFVLKRMPVLCNVPALAANVLAREFGLRTSPLPFASPRFDVGVVWQRTLANDALTLWLVDQIVSMLIDASARRRPESLLSS